MAWPTATEIRTFLDGYKITVALLPDVWIETRLSNFVQPFIERICKQNFTSEDSFTEYLSGTGSQILQLSRRPVNSIVSVQYVTGSDFDSNIGLNGLQLIGDEGLVKTTQVVTEGSYNSTWRRGNRNIKIVYKAGSDTVPDIVKEAAIYLASEQILGYVGSRTGGGSISVQGFSRNFGTRGRYQDVRNDLKRWAMFNLRSYLTTVVGSVGR